ncbi:peptidase G2 autoproteolytic cleavage domain-containing protein [Paenibacillus silagei]|uniref:Autotransporter adhesin n=1 Tax=Paenibacillus silagei TaxID=1670801 RepID=A0ABS4NPG8_9BACL|nr:peptidase G2 autoproteolytic cleavage domain-containing protein [Paenibacillus silagei]MBP2111237.1 autotransporter adhesin [Paenibacillus silagei]
MADEGCNQTASGSCSHAEGNSTTASGFASHAEGYETTSSASASHAEGYQTIAFLDMAHAEGNGTLASGPASHAEGYRTFAVNDAAHAEGGLTTASGTQSHAEGAQTTASGTQSHAEGNQTTASGEISHAEGQYSTASGAFAHAEGGDTLAAGNGSHAEGLLTQANGLSSHAEGFSTIAGGSNSHAEGSNTIALPDHPNSHIMGTNGQTLYPGSWHLANGSSSAPDLAAVLQGSTGNLYLQGTVISPGADYAEMFETVDGLPIEPGYFVTTDGERVRKATPSDQYILGVVSASPSFLGNASHLNWSGKYAVDKWGRVIYEDRAVEAVTDNEGNILAPAHFVNTAVINPQFDPSQTYVSRMDRPEWVAVGTMGKLLVRDDGTCQVNGFCLPGENGVATASVEGYRVLARTAPDQIRIYVK